MRADFPLYFRFLLLVSISATSVSAIRDDDNCAGVNDIADFSDRCKFVEATDDCKLNSGHVDYVHFIYCHMTDRVKQIFGFFILAFWLCYLLMAMGVASGKFFGPNLPVIADALHMSENVAGETLLALGNGAPDLFTSLAAALNMKNNGDAGFLYGELLGSGLFVTTVIVGVVVAIKPFKTMKRALLRDIIFYMCAIYCAFATLWDGVIHLEESIAFLAIYAVYMLMVISATCISPKFDKFMSKHWRRRGHPRARTHPTSTNSFQQRENLDYNSEPPQQSILTSPVSETDVADVSATMAVVSLLSVDEGPTDENAATTSPIVLSGASTFGSQGNDARDTSDASDNTNNNKDSNDSALSELNKKGENKTVVLQEAIPSIGTPTISVTRTSRALLTARRSQQPTTKKSQSMKVHQLRVDAELDRRKSRQLSLLGPHSRNRLAAPVSQEGRPFKNEHETIDGKSSIPHAARLMIRSASNKDKSYNRDKDPHEKGERRHSIPTSRAAKESSQTPTVHELKDLASEIMNALHVRPNSSAAVTSGIVEVPHLQQQRPQQSSEELLDAERTPGGNGSAGQEPGSQSNSFIDQNISAAFHDSTTNGGNNQDGADVPPLTDKTVCGLLFQGLNPIDINTMRRQSWHRNIIRVIRAPAVFCMSLTIPVINEDKPEFNWNRPLNCLHCVISPLFCGAVVLGGYMQYKIGNLMPVAALIAIVGFFVAVVVGFTSTNAQRPKYHVAFAFLGFLTTIAWIYSLANEIISILQCFGLALSISRSFLGLTCLAWGNSIGDLINDATIARQGYPKMAISACYGGMLFNLLLGLGVPLLVATIRHGGAIFIRQPHTVTLLFICLGINTVTSFVAITLVQDFYLRRPFAVFLFCVYLAFLICALLTETGQISPNIFPTV